MEQSYEEAINGFEKKRILVVGDLILDNYSYGEINRTNPEQPASHLVDVHSEEYMLGGAGNVARNIRSLGASVFLVGIIGKDNNGKKILDLAEKEGIDTYTFFSDFETLFKQRILAHGQQIVRIDGGKKYLLNNEDQNSFLKIICRCIEKSDAILLSDYDKGTLNESIVQQIINMAKEKEKKVYSAIKPQNANYFRNSYLISCNAKEAEQVTGLYPDNDKLVSVGKKISDELNSKYSMITLSERGIFSYDSSGSHIFIPTKAKEVIDVSGAGDTVISTFALANLDLDINSSAKLANIAAGIVVGKSGTAVCSKKELLEAIKQS